MKVIIILAYFGKLPNYFDLFLSSCGKNGNFDYLILTDQTINSKYNNIKTINLSFRDFCKKITNRIGSIYMLRSPYKICDYKPVLGKICFDYIKHYDYWGHCDCDLIFGNLDGIKKVIDTGKYDRILTEGHLTFYRNCPKILNLYKKEVFPAISFRKAASLDEPCFYDELSSVYICKKNGIVIFENKALYADILPQYANFRMPRLNIENQTFCYENGKLFRIQDNREFIYIHLQKRNMKLKVAASSKKYYIIPNEFTDSIHKKKIADHKPRLTQKNKRLIDCLNHPRKIIIKCQTWLMKALLK